MAAAVTLDLCDAHRLDTLAIIHRRHLDSALIDGGLIWILNCFERAFVAHLEGLALPVLFSALDVQVRVVS